jgi:hypothetical protein
VGPAWLESQSLGNNLGSGREDEVDVGGGGKKTLLSTR